VLFRSRDYCGLVNEAKKMVNSHQAFADVDKMVSKPVFGSDGALAWKKFKEENKQAQKGGVFAPNLPMKRSDRLGTGSKSIEEERLLENEIRKKSGNALSKHFTFELYLCLVI